MPDNLTQQAIARRDQAMQAFDSVRGRTSQFSRIPGKGADTADAAAARQDLNERKFSAEQSKTAFDQAMKMSEQERRVQAATARSELADRRAAIAESQLKLNESMAQLRDLQAETKLKDAQQAINDKVGFLKATQDLKPGTPDFDAKLTEAAALFPHAAADDFVQKRVDWLMKSHDTATKLQQQQEKDKAAAAIVAAQKLQPTSVKVGDTTYEAPKTATPLNPEVRLQHLEEMRSRIPDKPLSLSDADMAKDAQFKDRRAYLDGEITSLRQQLQSSGAPAASSATPPVVAVTPGVTPATPSAIVQPATSPAIPAVPSAADQHPDITPEAHAALQPGETYYFGGQPYTKQ